MVQSVWDSAPSPFHLRQAHTGCWYLLSCRLSCSSTSATPVSLGLHAIHAPARKGVSGRLTWLLEEKVEFEITRSLLITIRLPKAEYTRFEKVESLMISFCLVILSTAPGSDSSVSKFTPAQPCITLAKHMQLGTRALLFIDTKDMSHGCSAASSTDSLLQITAGLGAPLAFLQGVEPHL